MKHRYVCCACNHDFMVEDGEKFDHEPQTRKCRKCKKNPLMYMGAMAWFNPPVSDTLDGVWNPVDGKRYDSKAKYYRAVKDAGCEIAGNDSSLGKKHESKELSSYERKGDIARALEG